MKSTDVILVTTPALAGFHPSNLSVKTSDIACGEIYNLDQIHKDKL
jgi:hypothetical protein